MTYETIMEAKDAEIARLNETVEHHIKANGIWRRNAEASDQENVQLRATIVELEDERNAAQSQRLTALDLIVTTQAKLAELEAENRTLVRDLAIAVEDGYNKRDQIEHIESDLHAARTAAELAATHRKALEQLVREWMTIDTVINDDRPCVCEQCTQAKELLSQDSLTPSKTEQLTSLVKAYALYVIQYGATTDSNAIEAYDMLIEQYNRVLGEVKHA